MDSHGDAAAVFAILIIFGGPIAWAIANRSFAHKERMAMIERGLVPPDQAGGFPPQGPFGARNPGRGATQYAPYQMDYYQWQAGRMLHKGIVLGMIGLAMTIGLGTIDGYVGHPGPWLLGGLIPMFIGIAQIVTALMSGARFPISRRVAAPIGPAPGPASAPGPGAAYEAPPRDVTPGPYAWRPGPTTELERPPSPPDTR